MDVNPYFLYQIIYEIISNKKELSLLFSNNNIIKNKTAKKIYKNKSSVFILNSQFHIFENIINIKSNCFFISKDIIIVITKYIYDYINGYADKIKIQNLNIEYNLDNSKNIDNYFGNIIIENNKTKNIITIIKLINEELVSDYYFDIRPDINILSGDIFIANHKAEKPIKINNYKSKEFTNYNNGTPVFIKKGNKKYLIGIKNNNNFYIFTKEELLYIKNIYYLYQVKIRLY